MISLLPILKGIIPRSGGRGAGRGPGPARKCPFLINI